MIKVVTDSVSDIPKEYVDKYDITVIPLKIIFVDKEYTDRVDIVPEQVYKRIKENNEFPKTSQITPYEFESIFDSLTKNEDEVIGIFMSSSMSGTYNSAILAKKALLDRKIEIIDSKAITLGYGLIVIEAAKMAKQGKRLVEIKQRIESMVKNMEYLIVFDTLEYAYKGGRISKTQYILANFLNLKVVITLENGEMIVKDKIRGRKRVIKWIIDYIKENKFDLNDKVIGINHANDRPYLDELKNAICDEFSPKEIVLSDVGCTVAAYSGLSAVAIYFEREI